MISSVLYIPRFFVQIFVWLLYKLYLFWYLKNHINIFLWKTTQLNQIVRRWIILIDWIELVLFA